MMPETSLLTSFFGFPKYFVQCFSSVGNSYSTVPCVANFLVPMFHPLLKRLYNFDVPTVCNALLDATSHHRNLYSASTRASSTREKNLCSCNIHPQISLASS